MAQAEQKGLHPFQESTVVDTDVHLSALGLLDVIHEYIDEEPYHSKAKRTRVPWSLDGWDRENAGKNEQDSARSSDDIKGKLCDGLGVDYPIINSFALVTRTPEDGFATALARGYNDLMLDRFLDEDGFTGLASIAPQQPHTAAEEIDRLGSEKDIVGVFLPSFGTRELLGDPKYDVIYQAAQDNDLPIVYHGGSGSVLSDYPIVKFRTFLNVHINGFLWSTSQTLTSIILNGVPEKFPGLEYVFLESGIGWIPYIMARMNKEYSMRRNEAPLLEKSPEQYVRDTCYFATQPLGEPENPEHVRSLLQIMGEDMMVFSTDYPHWDFDAPVSIARELQAALGEDGRDRVLHGNAMEIFDLDS